MATLVLSSVGSLLGPVGEMVGALAGNAIDNILFAPRDREGARLKELAVSSSSYGNPLARQYGTMRVPGTIIWSSDLVEHREKHSNGKGQPKTIAYSYSVSFAVALSSGPIDGLGRIWADGNLLRGRAGDLKSAGTLRVYNGRADQPRDPLLSAALGEECPAYRGCAYAVFEDLDLTDFGNRIPALSFEVMAGDAGNILPELLSSQNMEAGAAAYFPELSGFSHEGGTLRDIAQLVDVLHPIAPQYASGAIILHGAASQEAEIVGIADPVAWGDGEFGQQAGYATTRADRAQERFDALRYYDPARDYQPGMQRAAAGPAQARTFQFPGAFAAGDALKLAGRANRRATARIERLLWRCAELNPSLQPGSIVRPQGIPGLWQIAGWEWRDGGVEMELVRYRDPSGQRSMADPGKAWLPRDRQGSPTTLRVFETPWDGRGSAISRRLYAAVGAGAGRWSGASLYSLRDQALAPLGQSAQLRATSGQLEEPLAASTTVRFEPRAHMVISLPDPLANLTDTDMAGLASGENRLLVGGEVVQFLNAEKLPESRWRLTGLLRGRGATEQEAAKTHAASTPVTLLDDTIVDLSDNQIALAAQDFAAIGLWDEQPARAVLENRGVSVKPPCPVHAKGAATSSGGMHLSWRRRARGQWSWLDASEQPLVEETESYEVGFGPGDAPFGIWSVREPQLSIPASEFQALLALHGSQPFWVRQRGTYASSLAVLVDISD